jgi:hypothetical protein
MRRIILKKREMLVERLTIMEVEEKLYLSLMIDING